MKLVTLLLPEAYLEGLDRLIGTGLYPSRSAVIRYAVMDLLKSELWRQETIKQESKRKRARGASKEEVQMAKMHRRKTIRRKKRAKTLKNRERYQKRES